MLGIPFGFHGGAVLAIFVAMLGGCASRPTASSQVLATPPEVGDTLRSIADRGHQVFPVYVFRMDGRVYGFANAYVNGVGQDLVLIDGRLACAHEAALTELTDWEWVADPEGLAYLASRLRQSCGLEPPTPARSLPLNGAGQPEPSPPMEPQRSLDELFGQEHPIANGLAFSVLMSLWLVYGPLFAVAGALEDAAAVSAPPSPVPDPQAESSMRLQLDMTRERLTQLLGRPAIEFQLPRSGTTVLGYDLRSSRSYFVGLSGDRVVWLHGPYFWLDELARAAKAGETRTR
jgi:hypothetical protein